MSKSIESEIPLIAPLANFSSADLLSAGGKGANLGELVRAGFPVPAGFVVTTAAYDRFVARHQLDQTIARVLREQPGGSVNGAAIREAFERAAVPAELEQQLIAAYQALGKGPVAVRSSATAEDLPGAAFAGQQETFLNITDEAGLLDAVRRCWASLWGDRAIAYRERLALDEQSVKLAVVVQKMVAADYAGVLFTANPVSGERDAIALDANPGLGEAVVSGLVTPDHYLLRKTRLGWKIVERRPGRREVMVRARSGGGTEQVPGPLAGEGMALPDSALYRLARLGAAIQRHFGRPQDVEWAWAGGRLFILQARPMTALPEPPPRANLPQRLLASNFGEMIPTRPYPLDLSTWLPALSDAVEPIFEVLGMDWSLDRMFEIEDGVVIRYKSSLPRPTWRVLSAPARLVSLGLRYDPLRWQSDPLLLETLARARALEAALKPGDLPQLSWGQLIEAARAAREIPFLAAGEIRRRYFPRAAFAAVRLRLMLGLLGETGQFSVLLSGAENKTVEANQGLEQLAGRIRADADLASLFARYEPNQLLPMLADRPSGRAFLDDLHTFLDRYGHRETTISTALHPTWKDAPEAVLGMIKSFAAYPSPSQTGRPAWQKARDEILRRRLLRFAPLRSAFLKTLAEARALLQIREDTHFYATLAMPLFRRTFLEMGDRLARAGVLDAPEDIFHLTFEELESLPDDGLLTGEQKTALRASALRRKQARAGLEGVPLVDPRLLLHTAPAGDALLKGMPGSPGVAEGPARVVRDVSEFDRLKTGDVLVAPYTNPSWTPLFQRAAAVIVDSGSAASHAAIVAREYGIPAVMSTITGTQALHDGDRIRVDGSQGLVYRVTPQVAAAEAQERVE